MGDRARDRAGKQPARQPLGPAAQGLHRAAPRSLGAHLVGGHHPAAGAQALVTSLWRSNDAATSRMMRSFYEALISEELEADALRGAEALRRAKLAQLASETRLGIRRPLIWANFIFSGVL